MSPVKSSGLIKMCHFQDNRVHIGPKMEIRVVTLGLDGAGKTTILFKLKQDEFMQPIPTIGKTFTLELLAHVVNDDTRIHFS